MTFKLIWLADVLREANLKVIEEPGWKTRGVGGADMGVVKGVLCHHTAGPRSGDHPSLGTVMQGRTGLRPPLCHLLLSRDGTFFVVAAGKANHAGVGNWQGVRNGNTQLIGIEGENTGLANDQPWPAIQMNAYERGCVALCKKLGVGSIMVAGHKEYALPHGRKPDPSFNMADFRKEIARLLGE
jgi:hypothetical protein